MATGPMMWSDAFPGRPSLEPPSDSPPSTGRLPPPPFANAEFADAEPRHLRDYLRVLRRQRRLAGACFGVTVGVAILVTVFTPRAYTSSTHLQVARQSPIQLPLKDNVRRLDDGDTDPVAAANFLATQVTALKSRDLAERVIQRWGLTTNDAFLRPNARQRDLLPVAGSLRPRGWEEATAGSTRPPVAGGGHVDPKLLDRYTRYLAVSEMQGTNLVDVSFTTPSPVLSAFLVAAHTQAYLESNREARRATDDIAAEFLGRQLHDALKQVKQSEIVLRRFSREHPRVAADQELKVSTSRMGELSTLLAKAEGERATLESRYTFLTGAHGDPQAYFLDRPGVQKLRLNLLDARAQRAALGRLGPNHPQIAELTQLEDELEQQLRAEVARGVASVRAQFDAARLRVDQLRGKLRREESDGLELRKLGAQYTRLKTDVEAARALRTSLLKQRMDTNVDSDLDAPNVRIIERAEVPVRPSRPKILLDLTLGVFAGLVIALGAAFARDYFDASVRSNAEVEELLQLPTLATIPNFSLAAALPPVRPLLARVRGKNGGAPAIGSREPNGRGGELLVVQEPWSRVAEAFRSMRTAVLFSVPGAPPKVILVTSARAGEGKTVASLNLAAALAEGGARVVLVDADLRHPRCHVALGVENDCGLADCLGGTGSLDGAIRVTGAVQLFLLPAGRPPTNPVQLVSSLRMRHVLARLRDVFDFVVVDTPPLLPVTDATVLAREADGVVLVVKGHDTPRELVRQARDRLLLAGANFLGVMVNNVGLRWDDPYFHDGYYGYGRPAERTQQA